jgi:hypothetical protein
MRPAVAVLALVVLTACGMRHSPGQPIVARAFGATAADFDRLREGMSQSTVQTLVGPPFSVDHEVTWKAWIALLPLPDAWRYVYHYDGLGVVRFSCGVLNRDCSATEIVRTPESVPYH